MSDFMLIIFVKQYYILDLLTISKYSNNNYQSHKLNCLVIQHAKE